ncbi:MAG: hypothetical protein WBM17_04960 [Anaerolineales bacterium]
MKRLPGSIGVLLVLLSACAPRSAAPTIEIQAASASATGQTPSASQTRRPRPTATASFTESPTPSATSSFPTATFDAAGVVTFTPASPVVCPEPDPKAVFLVPEDYSGVASAVLEYLNAGGSFAVIEAGLEKIHLRIAQWDLTNDGIPEIAFAAIRTYIFGCRDGRYITLFEEGDGDSTYLSGVLDMNLDGVLEFVYASDYFGANDYTMYYRILEWRDAGFRDLISDVEITSRKVMGGSADREAWMFNGMESLEDTDGNGTVELLVRGGNDGGMSACSWGPVRNETHVWMWNGVEFGLSAMRLDSPAYRFQVVFDADEASLAGNYSAAENLYNRAIQDNGLFGRERFFGGETFCSQGLVLDPAEWPNLTAYARYRILLIRILLADGRAESLLQSLQKDFPAGRYGNAYAALAAEMWAEYNKNHNLGDACLSAVAFAKAHPEEILKPLGGGEYAYYGEGMQNNSYVPQDICPFE